MAELMTQIKALLAQDDRQSIKYLISDESAEVIESICLNLSPQQAAVLRQLFQSTQDGDLSFQMDELGHKQARNKKIDKHLQEEENQLQKKEESYLQTISKIYEKLIYEQHFGYPFYDLFKRIQSTHGDFKPNVQTVKTMHSQVQILYSSIFTEDALNCVSEKYPKDFDKGMRAYLSEIFSNECEKYFKFLSLYKKLKKQTSEKPDEHGEEEELKQIEISQDETLEMDQKAFLVSSAENAPREEFQQIIRNRSYNFLCFGLKKFQTYIALGSAVFAKLKEKEFCELLSFLTLRFVRKIIFTINRERSGDGQLRPLKEPITSLDIKRVGNDLVDQYVQKIELFLMPVRSVEQQAHHLFTAEFHSSNYKDFVPARYFTEASKNEQDVAEYVWNQSREYRALWSQRIKAERFIKQGGERPQLDYISHIDANKQKFHSSSAKLWKEFIMAKFGFEQEARVMPRKRMKLDSLND